MAGVDVWSVWSLREMTVFCKALIVPLCTISIKRVLFAASYPSAFAELTNKAGLLRLDTNGLITPLNISGASFGSN